MSKVVIVERRMTHYRIELFNRMREQLEQEAIELQVIYSDPNSIEVSRHDSADLSWGIYLPASYWFGDRLCWFNPGAFLGDADLVILPQENSILYTLLLVIFGAPFRLAYWGHGKNLQPKNSQHFSEKLKSSLINRVDWWFAYTQHTFDYLTSQGVEDQKITVLNNTIDTEEFVSQLDSITEAEKQYFLESHGLNSNGEYAVYCGSLSKDKGIDFLLASAIEIKKQRENFNLLVVGSGSEQPILDEYVSRYSWIVPLGALKGKEKALIFSLASILTIPSAVGLIAVDALVAGVPIVTRRNEKHGPEIAYLTHELTAIITEPSMTDYVRAVCELLDSPEKISALSKAGLSLRGEFTIASMAQRFTNGIFAALLRPKNI